MVWARCFLSWPQASSNVRMEAHHTNVSPSSLFAGTMYCASHQNHLVHQGLMGAAFGIALLNDVYARRAQRSNLHGLPSVLRLTWRRQRRCRATANLRFNVIWQFGLRQLAMSVGSNELLL